MLVVLLSIFVLAVAAPMLYRVGRGAAEVVFILVPAAAFVYFLTLVEPVAAGRRITAAVDWVPSLGVQIALDLDGLALLFALLITGIGTLIVIYARTYLAGHVNKGPFYLYLIGFMGSMLGVVLAGNLFALYGFWELTTLTSYLLIGFDHRAEGVRNSALQSLLVTTVGGLCMLAGFVLLGQAGGSYEIATLLERGEQIRAHPHFGAILALVVLGAFTKSAQFPFHFWLPNAMVAPTPISAYLHSATMVKAGVYLLARLSPALGENFAWFAVLATVGSITMLLGAVLAVLERDLKRILAYATISSLGMAVMLISLGTEEAAVAAVLLILSHALYKGALFLVAGSIDHAVHARDVAHLGGLWRKMPLTTVVAVLGAASMAGVVPLLGFVAKETILEAVQHLPQAALLLTIAVVLNSVLQVAAALLVGYRPFRGSLSKVTAKAYESPAAMWLGPAVLAALGLVMGLFPGETAQPLIEPAAASLADLTLPVKVELWHGFNLVFMLSLLSLAVGVVLYAALNAFRALIPLREALSRIGPARGYQVVLAAMLRSATVQTRVLQNGYLRSYLLLTLLTAIVLMALAAGGRFRTVNNMQWEDVRFWEATTAVVILVAGVLSAATDSRLAAIASLGVVGYGVALVFVLFGAPDLATTQFMIETLTVILFLLVFRHLPRFTDLSHAPARTRDALIAGTTGLVITVTLLLVTGQREHPPVSHYFAEHSFLLAHGRNVVNMILVDFRALDTLGEIAVLGVAGVGVYALLRLRPPKDKEQDQ